MEVRLLSLVTPLALASLLLAAGAAHASPGLPALVPLALEEEWEVEEGEFEAVEECLTEAELETEELAAEAPEEDCEEAVDAAPPSVGDAPPAECLLRSSRARVVADPDRNRLKLTLGYTTYAPTPATVEYGIDLGDRQLRIGTVKRRLGRSGVLRLTKSLSDPQLAKLEASGRLTVRVHGLDAPPSCRRFETEQLTVKPAMARLASRPGKG